MKSSKPLQNVEQTSEETQVTLQGAHVFENEDLEITSQSKIRPALSVNNIESIDVIDETIVESISIDVPKREPKKTSKWKWRFWLFLAVLIASVAELSIYIIAMIEQVDWLAGVWLIIFSGLGILALCHIFIELKGLKQLKHQQHMRAQSEQMATTSVIGLAEQHCIVIAKNLPEKYKYMITNWRDSFESHHSDSEVLALFEHHVLAPIDKLAIQQVSKNASAASVMIAVSPFALLDMLIVLWRNIRMMNQVSEIYGLQLGYWGRIKLIRKVFHTMLYAGAAEILSDAGNYALSAGITGKLSTRIAQGMGAGVLTARIGLKAINESRPMPWISQNKPNLTAISKQLLADLNTQLT